MRWSGWLESRCHSTSSCKPLSDICLLSLVSAINAWTSSTFSCDIGLLLQTHGFESFGVVAELTAEGDSAVYDVEEEAVSLADLDPGGSCISDEVHLGGHLVAKINAVLGHF